MCDDRFWECVYFISGTEKRKGDIPCLFRVMIQPQKLTQIMNFEVNFHSHINLRIYINSNEQDLIFYLNIENVFYSR